VNPSYPHLGATPDRIINCDCCGDGVIEIKCPPSSIETNIHIMSLICYFTSSKTKMESCVFGAITNITIKHRANLLCVKRSTVTSCAGPYIACTWNAFSLNQHILMTLSQLLIRSSLAEVNYQSKVPIIW